MAYPKSIFFIVICEFCERYAFLGVVATSALYLHNRLLFSTNISTLIFHVFLVLAYSFPIVAAIIADNLFGKFKMVVLMSIIGACGYLLLSIGAIIEHLAISRSISLIALLTISIGTGGRKPCLAAFGGDQFTLPDQKKQLSIYFAILYFAANAGSVISKLITPILHHEVVCFTEGHCYPLAFGSLALMMVLGAVQIPILVTFYCGIRWYKMNEPTENMLIRVFRCIVNAIKKRRPLRKGGDIRDHWLDYSREDYSEELIADIKIVFRILLLFLAVPMYWALFNQQASRWAFQASRMDGEIGSFSILPDQMQAINPLLVMIFIPIFQYGIYPLLVFCKISRPLQKMAIGGILNGVSFILSGVVELQLEATYPVVPSSGLVQLRIYNGYNEPVSVQLNDAPFIIPALSIYENKKIPIKGQKMKEITIMPQSISPIVEEETEPEKAEAEEEIGAGEEKPKEMKIRLVEAEAISLWISPNKIDPFVDDVFKSSNGFPAVRILFAPGVNDDSSKVQIKDHATGALVMTAGPSGTGRVIVPPANYDILVQNKKITSNYKLQLGGVYTIIVTSTEEDNYKANIHTITKPNSLSVLWLIPQYVVISMGEVMFVVTGMQFSFSQAPISMKSVLQAVWLLTITVGNILVVFIAGLASCSEQSSEFFLFAMFMFGDMIIFILFAMGYKYVDEE